MKLTEVQRHYLQVAVVHGRLHQHSTTRRIQPSSIRPLIKWGLMTEDRRITGAGRALVMAPPRSLAEIARQIRIEWPANTMTRQRITAMDYLGQMEKWEMPEAVNAVRGFLDHCQAWRGTVAQQVKDELLGMLHANGISMRAYRGVGVRR